MGEVQKMTIRMDHECQESSHRVKQNHARTAGRCTGMRRQRAERRGDGGRKGVRSRGRGYYNGPESNSDDNDKDLNCSDQH